MEATLPRWAALVVGTGTRCAVFTIAIFLLTMVLMRLALSSRDLTARHRIIASTLWGLVFSALAPGVLLAVAVRGGLVRGLAERLGDGALGVAACLMTVHLIATVVVMMAFVRTRASLVGGCRAQWSHGLVFLARDQWARFRSAVAAQWTAMVVALLLGLLVVAAAGYGVLWPQRRIAFAVWAGLDLFAWIACLVGSGVLGGEQGASETSQKGRGEVVEQRREP